MFSDHRNAHRDEAVKEALIVLWEASDRICGKRLKAVMPVFIETMERNGHLDLDEEVKRLLLQMSASTIDRMLRQIREQAKGKRRKRNAPKKASKQIPVRTFSDWDDPVPGELEIDFVVHCGDSMTGACIHSLAATDVCSGWTEAVPLIAREQSLVAEALDVICRQFPVPVLGFNSDNDSAEKRREGAKEIKKYSKPMTPAARLLEHPGVCHEDKQRISREQMRLDPLALLHSIRDTQAALAMLKEPDSANRPGRELDEFLAQLPRLWKMGEARPTHRKAKDGRSSHGRTRPDPFAEDWPEVLLWLSEEPDVTAKSLFLRLMDKYPGKYSNGQLRTLQRRVKEWRYAMARELVFACAEPEEDMVSTSR